MVGEHIRALKGGRWIHAIDCGDQTVLHLSEDAEPRRVRRAYRPEFVAGAQTVEQVTHRERTFPPREVVRRAYSRASDPSLATMFLDSEAFAAWCTTGRLAAARNVAVQVPGVPPLADAPAAEIAPAAEPRRAKRSGARTAKAKRSSRTPKRAIAARGAAPRRKKAAATAGGARRKAARAGPAKRATKPAKRRRSRR